MQWSERSLESTPSSEPLSTDRASGNVSPEVQAIEALPCHTSTHHRKTLPTLVPLHLTTTLALSAKGPPTCTPSSDALALYFDGLAAGDDLADLIRYLRATMWSRYCDCLHAEELLHQPSTSTSTHSARHDALSSRQASAKMAQDRATQAHTGHTTRTAPATLHPLPRGTLPAAERRQYWSATKAALLFATESAAAMEEATTLHYSPAARTLLYAHYYPLGTGDGGAATLTLPLLGAGRHVEVQWVLSDVRVVALAREEVRRDAKHGWRRALQLLQQVAPTPRTCAAELELYRHTDGHHWAEALECLDRIPPSQWTEMDVGTALRCLYCAGRHVRPSRGVPQKSFSFSKPLAATGASGTIDDLDTRAQQSQAKRDSRNASRDDDVTQVHRSRLVAQALRIHRFVEETARLQWSTPSALNDTLGLIACDASAWEAACLLLDKLLASSPVEKESHQQGEDIHDDATVALTPVRTTAPSSVTATYALARPNAVTVHQTCRALRSQWAAGLRYVQCLQDTFPGSLNVLSDMAATEDVLRLCIAGQRWQEALKLVMAHQAFRKGSAPTTSSSALSSVAGAVTAQLPQQRTHYQPELFVQLVRLLSSSPPSRDVAVELVKSYTSKERPAVSAPVNEKAEKAGRRERSALRFSKHYNANTLSRAHNCLVQGSDTLAAVDAILHNMQKPHPQESGGSERMPGERAADLVNRDAQLAGLETESVAHIAFLSSVAGDWQRALHHTDALLHDPRYRPTFLPTARLHDAVQYALEQAPPPGPSWQVSLRLFTDMMDRHVPISEVSFQSAVKMCFAGGATEQAQRLFHAALRRGVRA